MKSIAVLKMDPSLTIGINLLNVAYFTSDQKTGKVKIRFFDENFSTELEGEAAKSFLVAAKKAKL
jgi:hypothetical protein